MKAWLSAARPVGTVLIWTGVVIVAGAFVLQHTARRFDPRDVLLPVGVAVNLLGILLETYGTYRSKQSAARTRQ